MSTKQSPLVVLLVGLVLLSGSAAHAQPMIDQIYPHAANALVRLRSTILLANKLRDYRHGTGVVISDRGHVLTASHVVPENALSIDGTIGSSQANVVLRVVMRDERRDLAVLEFTTRVNYSSIELTNSDKYKVANDLYAMGFGGDGEIQLIGKATLAAMGRGRWSTRGFNLAPGDSGSPVFSASGSLIGVAVAERVGEPVAYVIPMNEAASICLKIRCNASDDYPGQRPPPPAPPTASLVPKKPKAVGPSMTDSGNIKLFGFTDFSPVNGLGRQYDCSCDEPYGALGFIGVLEGVFSDEFGPRIAISGATLEDRRTLEDGVTRRYVNDTFISFGLNRLLYGNSAVAWTAFAAPVWAIAQIEDWASTTAVAGSPSALVTVTSTTQATTYQHRFGGVLGTDLSLRIASRIKVAITIELNLVGRSDLPRMNTRGGIGLGIAF